MASSSFSAFASISKRLISRSLVLPRRQRLFLGAASARSYSTSLSFDPVSIREPQTMLPPSGASPSSAPSKTASIKAFTRGFLWGKVGQNPVQKYFRSGRAVVLFSLGTEGIRHNRRLLEALIMRNREITPIDFLCSGTGSVCTQIGSAT